MTRTLFALTLAAALLSAPFVPAQAATKAQHATQQAADPELATLKATRAALAAQLKARKAETQKAKLRAQIEALQAKLADE
jgi:ABC-type transporter MlaC component